MAKLSPGQLYAAARGVGFPPAGAFTLTEIELAESGGDVDAVGDVSLEDSTWGPSVGAPQIRTVKAQTGSGGVRDIDTLQGDITAQDTAAWAISSHGANFGPWSTYRNGAYARFQSTVANAVGSDTSSSTGSNGSPLTLTSGGGPLPTFGPSWLPWNLLSDAGNEALSAAQGSLLSGSRGIVLEVGAALAAVALIGLGAYRLAAPKIKQGAAQAAKVAVAL